jgi:hypothetical protein
VILYGKKQIKQTTALAAFRICPKSDRRRASNVCSAGRL